MTKHTRELTQLAGRRPERLNLPRPLPCHELEIPDEVADRIDALFLDLKGIRPGWRATWANPEIEESAKRQWALTLLEHGLAGHEQIEAGIARCRRIRGTYVPSPSDFAELCKPQPEDYGFPSLEAAFALALHASHPSSNGFCPNPVVLEAVRAVGAHLLFHGVEEVSRARFAQAYSTAVCRILAGGQPLQIEDRLQIQGPQPTGRCKATGRKALAELRARMGRRPGAAEDPRA